MGRKQKERQKKKNNKLLATSMSTSASTSTSTSTSTSAVATTATATASSGDDVDVNNSATAGRNSSVYVDVVIGAAAAKKGTTTETTTMATCYHGSTAENFANGSNFQMAIDEWKSFCVNIDSTNMAKSAIQLSKYNQKYMNLLQDPEFIKYIFAFATGVYLNASNCGSLEDTDFFVTTMSDKLYFILDFGIMKKYGNGVDVEKQRKYDFDIKSNRGVINCLYRETKTFCNCMKPYKDEAKSMEKVGACTGCPNYFPKLKLRRCSRCLAARYCTNKCMKKHWPTHKQFCTPHNEQKSEEE